MQVYGVGGSPEELARLQALCLENGWHFRAARGVGRPPVARPAQEVLDTYRATGSIKATARILKMAPATVSRILRQAGCPIRGAGRGGRPPLPCPPSAVLAAYHATGTIRGAAQALNISPATALRRLRQAQGR